jgi:hypothetical protein
MATSSGALLIRQDSGRVKHMGGRKLFGDLLLRIIRALNPRYEEQEYRVVDCGLYDVRITDGVAVIENFAIQTDTMTVIVLGNLDFNTEKLNLTVRAKPREGIGVSIGGTVNAFLKVGGTLRDPKLQIDPKGTLVSGGAAVATGGLSILAKGLYDRLSANKDICATEADGKSP